MSFLTFEQVILKMTKIIFTYLQNHWILKTTLLDHLQGTEEYGLIGCVCQNSFCLFLLLFLHTSRLNRDLCARCSTDRPSNSSGLQMFTPSECLHCSGSLRPQPSTVKSCRKGELTPDECQLCSPRELFVHWSYPANTGCALPNTHLPS